MAANKFTIKAVTAILETDMAVSAIIRNSVVKLLGEEPELSCGEQEAARILQVGGSTLYNWRVGKWEKCPHPFFFKCWFTPANEVRYDKEQLLAYAELRRILSTRNAPQPHITEEDVRKYLDIKADIV